MSLELLSYCVFGSVMYHWSNQTLTICKSTFFYLFALATNRGGIYIAVYYIDIGVLFEIIEIWL